MIDQTAIVPAPAGGEPGALDGALQLGAITCEGPKALVAMATSVATELARVIEDRGLTVLIKGRPYVRVEGWTTCAAMLGVTAREVSVEARDDGSFVAVVELARVADGQVVGRGSAVCGPDEATWKGRPRYAIRSMATTRATGKACRLAFSWIISLAGYAATPAEEAADVDAERAAAKGRPTSGHRVLGQVPAARLLRRLEDLDRSFSDLLAGLRDHDPDAYSLCSGIEVQEIPAAAMEPIASMLERFAQAHESEAVAVGSEALSDVDEKDIPF